MARNKFPGNRSFKHTLEYVVHYIIAPVESIYGAGDDEKRREHIKEIKNMEGGTIKAYVRGYYYLSIYLRSPMHVLQIP